MYPNSPAPAMRRADLDDAVAIQAILNDVIAEGTSFLADRAMSLDETIQAWLTPPFEAYVACDAASGAVIGAYKIKPNLWGRGSHVANGSYMVTLRRRGQGLGYTLGSHSLVQARRAGYRAMQFNAVASTNLASVALWQRLGFTRIGIVPEGFRLVDGQYVDAYIFYRSLEDIAE